MMEPFTIAIFLNTKPAPKEVLVCTRNQNIDEVLVCTRNQNNDKSPIRERFIEKEKKLTDVSFALTPTFVQ